MRIVANKLTSVGVSVFNSTKVKSFVAKQLGYIGNNMLSSCPELTYVLFGSATHISYDAFRNSSNLCYAIFNSVTPPTIEGRVFDNTNSSLAIYVSDTSVTAYREASGWSAYADRIKPISQLATDNPSLYEEVAEYL